MLAAGDNHSLMLDKEGDVWSWGCNEHGRLGDGTLKNRSRPGRVGGLSEIISIEAGVAHSLALDKSGHVWAWGWNCHG